MSFVAIQDSQKQTQSVKDIRSFREIQEEEQSLQIEADFLKWWTAEEERVKHEALALTESENALNSSPKKGRNRRKGTEAKGNPELGSTGGGSSQLERFEQTNLGGQLSERRRPRGTPHELSQNRRVF
jgi:hypothetical protein